MLASLHHGHAVLARLACRPIVAQQVRAQATAKRTIKTTAGKGTKETSEAYTGKAPEDAVEDPTQVQAQRMAKLAAEEGEETQTTTDPTESETAEWESTGPETSEMHEGEEMEEERPLVERKRAAPMLKASGVVANKLLDSGIWNRTRGRKNLEALRVVDPRRVNVVSRKLCDSIGEYLGPSLERHRGCDLVDLNPGVGTWSQKLHDLLQPRKHVLMDLDAELYRPYLSKLLEQDNVELVPKSGIVWKDLLETMRTHLPDQTERDPESTPTRNDTLLVTANLSMFPKKTFHGFESVSTMVIYQLVSSIRTSSLFQKYGLVRMLVWINDEDKKRILPRALARRRRSAFEAEISCEWIHEIAGVDMPENRCALRDDWINTESTYRTVERMEAQGLSMPSSRANKAYKACMQKPELRGQALAGVHPPTLDRPFKTELGQLEMSERSNDLMTKRLRILRSRDKLVLAEALQYHEYLRRFMDISRLAASSPDEFAVADAEWNELMGNLKKNMRVEFNGIKDNYILFRQNPPAMLWDRRALEPLRVTPSDFFPNAPAALLDIQPKAMRPVFRQYGPASSRAGDMSDMMLRFWYQHTLFPIHKAMDGLWGGFGDLASQCPSLTDPDRGGSPLTGHGAMVSRAMNEEQWAEIVQAWMDWPFRPSYVQMLGRMVEEVNADTEEDDVKSGAMGSMF